MRKGLLIFTCALAFSSCGKKSVALPEGVLADSVMTAMIIDFAIVDASYSVSLTNSSLPRFRKEMFYEEVVKKHGSSREQFVKSLQYYSQNTKLLQSIYENALKELSRRQAEAVR